MSNSPPAFFAWTCVRLPATVNADSPTSAEAADQPLPPNPITFPCADVGPLKRRLAYVTNFDYRTQTATIYLGATKPDQPLRFFPLTPATSDIIGQQTPPLQTAGRQFGKKGFLNFSHPIFTDLVFVNEINQLQHPPPTPVDAFFGNVHLTAESHERFMRAASNYRTKIIARRARGLAANIPNPPPPPAPGPPGPPGPRGPPPPLLPPGPTQHQTSRSPTAPTWSSIVKGTAPTTSRTTWVPGPNLMEELAQRELANPTAHLFDFDDDSDEEPELELESDQPRVVLSCQPLTSTQEASFFDEDVVAIVEELRRGTRGQSVANGPQVMLRRPQTA